MVIVEILLSQQFNCSFLSKYLKQLKKKNQKAFWVEAG